MPMPPSPSRRTTSNRLVPAKVARSVDGSIAGQFYQRSAALGTPDAAGLARALLRLRLLLVRAHELRLGQDVPLHGCLQLGLRRRGELRQRGVEGVQLEEVAVAS